MADPRAAPGARLTGIVRRFGTVVALEGADLEVRAAEVHAVVGENGAGKSTLLAVLGGMLRPDAGSVEIAGSRVELRSPRDAWAHGIGLVHQHFTLVPTQSVLENLALGWRASGHGWRLPCDQIRAAATALMRRTALDVALDAPVDRLGVGDRQRVEILKALLRDPPLLALDEPTAVLAPSEVESLFALLRGLAAEGRAVVLVTHKIDEVLGVADHVTVLREGRTVLSAEREAVDGPGLVAAMVGRSEARTGAVVPVGAVGPRGRGAGKAAEPGTEPLATGVAEPVASEVAEPVATLERATVRGAGRRPALEGVSLSVRRGQILGVAGVEGNGQRELALVLAGRRAPDTGVARLPAGIGFIPQDRTREGLIGDFDLVENVALALHADERFARGPLLLWGELRARAETLRARFAIRAPSVDVRARTLSGGNQQRLVVGRELALAADLLVADNPTRGLDVAATAVVHEELFRLARSPGGPGVVLVSTDLDEVLALADRVVVMSRGRLLIPESGVPTREELGALMLGGRRELE